MVAQLDLRALERKAWRSTHDDGLWELFFGFMMFAGFAGGISDTPLVGIVIIFGALLFFLLGKRFVTVPRLGRVEFAPERMAKRDKTILIVSLAVLTTVVLHTAVTGILGSPLGAPELTNLGVSLFLFAVFAAMAHFLELARMYFIGAVFAGDNLLEGLYGTPIIPLVGAALLIVPGIVLLAQFLRRYPQPPGPSSNDGLPANREEPNHV